MGVANGLRAVNSAISCNSPLSDEEVVARVREGDTPLYEVLMRRYNQRLFRVARAILHDDDEAEDVMQHTYVKAYASLNQFAGKALFSTWLTKIAVYEAFSRLRSRKRIQDIEGNWTEDVHSMDSLKARDPNPEEQALKHEAVSLLERAVDHLPDLYRSVFVLREIEMMSTAETANCLALTEEAVKIRLLRARQMLRNELYARVGAVSAQAFQFMGVNCDQMVQRVLAVISSR
jgi:RNA polymerase sigma-70 factor, ECF subfamily